MSETNKNIAIGILVVIGILLVLRVLLFLHPSFGDGGFVFHARFYDIEKIGKGTRVTYAGRPVGEVKAITTLQRSAEEKGPVYSFDLTLAIDSKIELFTTDEIALSTSGLMGERSIAIMPKAVGKDSTPLMQNAILYAVKTPSMKDIAQKVQGTTANLESITDIVNKPEELTKMMQNAAKASENIAYASQEIKNGLPNIQQAMQDITAASHDIRSLAAKVSQGEGSIGQLFENDALYFKAYSVMDKADNLMDGITQYGLFFHSNKSWQRAQKEKQDEFAKEADPAKFQSLLVSEMQKISQSLEKLQKAVQVVKDLDDQEDMKRALNALSKDLARLQRQLQQQLQQQVQQQAQQTDK